VSAPLPLAREVLAGQRAYLVGGAVRDRLLGRDTDDVDVALDGDPRAAAKRIARVAHGAAFELSGAFGAWRAVGADHGWHIDVVPLRGGSLEADLAARDFTINAMAEPLEGGDPIDPHGGRGDLEARRLRMVSPRALADDPLRTLRAVRLAIELDLEIEPRPAETVAAEAAGLRRVSPERVFAELKRVIASPRVIDGLRLMERHGVLEAALPEVAALRGVEQSVYHHLDVYEHTLATLAAVVAIQADPAAAGLGDVAEPVRELLAEPLADELTRGSGLRLAALLHDAAKPQTRDTRPDGGVSFYDHEVQGAEQARATLRRLRASERLAAYVSALTLHHLRLGFLVHERPIDRRAAWRYLTVTAPNSADVTLLTVADRLATRGRKADAAISAHIELAVEMLQHAFALRAAGPQRPLVAGDELAAALGIRPGPELGALLAQIEEDRFAGEVSTPDEAIARARELRGG
jgi:poly(A) polymerase